MTFIKGAVERSTSRSVASFDKTKILAIKNLPVEEVFAILEHIVNLEKEVELVEKDRELIEKDRELALAHKDAELKVLRAEKDKDRELVEKDKALALVQKDLELAHKDTLLKVLDVEKKSLEKELLTSTQALTSRGIFEFYLKGIFTELGTRGNFNASSVCDALKKCKVSFLILITYRNIVYFT